MVSVPSRLLGIDTETTGADFRHGSRPFVLTTCDEQQVNRTWVWRVDPYTRMPIIPADDLEQARSILLQYRWWILHNSKFDATALSTVYDDFDDWWDWDNVDDTLIAAHLWASNKPKDLTALSALCIGVRIKQFEKELEQAVKDARTMVRNNHDGRFANWRIAREDDPNIPSAKNTERIWKHDLWLPAAVAYHLDYDADHPWHTITLQYANTDSSVLIPLHSFFVRDRKQRSLDAIYGERRKIPGIVYQIEKRGVTVNGDELRRLYAEFEEESDRRGRVCKRIAQDNYDYDLQLPKSGNNKSLHTFAFEQLKLPIVGYTEAGKPSLDKNALEQYQATLPERSLQLSFVNNLRIKRKLDTSLSYMRSYQRFWIPLDVDEYGAGWYILHPSLNSTGTATLRWSSSNPNEQNISKQEGYNLRSCMGPVPGREWWSMDAKNIELRIPAYEANETEMIYLFENPDAPPYFGSYHLLVFDVLHPEKFAKHGADCKKVYASTWYQWTKNGNFAVQYGAVEVSGTADRAYKVPGAQSKIQSRFANIAKLNRRMIEQADKYGYVETMPDKSVDPQRGYPLFCSRSNWGSVSPTVPLNYHVQGTAMWWMTKAMIRCNEYLRKLCKRTGKDYSIVMQVHDELVFDFPYAPNQGNLPIVLDLQRLMEQGGNDLGIPTPVGVEYHEHNWQDSVTVVAA